MDTLTRSEMIERVLAQYGRRTAAIDGYTYLVGSVGGHGVFLAPAGADLTEEMYEQCVEESDAAGLDGDRLYVHARRSLIVTDDVVFGHVDWRGPEAP
ncbi:MULTISPECIES: hypothetical protein [Mycobacteroides]|uniref:hypothetical protein n=1 Tax=Mycobacteroides TaxID=670516 RepID=UPI0008A86A7E|nr:MULTISPECIES: hypothetical protein [Mycobacteroides]AYM40377.1 hypothetical protein DYE20_01375 [[Mycobacterium] chelonae subsp. gwanakae]OHU15962.1 hypothetical protein BKG75_13035 [Mycobacteroides chelonae]SIF24213.1 Uncharacterised protein [Mycobacteroides abscessus subsp. abscessus]SIF37969.1 Uncharacterised protein [Mycobacteroides abscessus subsp. abscessus]SIF84795.1 Uncharacterised protein [Mycobacteroides abscessus subsp. abscessus]